MKVYIYLFLNFVVAGVILAIFLLSFFHNPSPKTYQHKCAHEELLGGKCPVCGMQDGFSEIVRGKFEVATIIQKNSIAIFLFFALILVMRLLVITVIFKSNYTIDSLINTDITFSFLIFLFSFRNIALQSIYIFYKMLITGNIV